MTQPLPCPVCESMKTNFLLKNSDFLFRTTRKEFSLYRCTACGCCFLSPFPTSVELKEAYPTPYWWIALPEKKTFAGRLEEFYREFVLRHHVRVARKHFPFPTPRVLDIGCGSGTFLHMLRQRTGITGQGMDLSNAAAGAARERYGLDVQVSDIDSADFPPGSFDFITLFHVLEHLPSPVKSLKKIATWLSEDGVLLLQVPNMDSWQFRWFQKRWVGMDIPRHLINFTPSSLRLTLEKAGFQTITVSFFSVRDNAPAMVSSLFPGMDPVSMTIRGVNRLVLLRKLLYFGMVMAAHPVAFVEALARRGGTMFAGAEKKTGSIGSY